MQQWCGVVINGFGIINPVLANPVLANHALAIHVLRGNRSIQQHLSLMFVVSDSILPIVMERDRVNTFEEKPGMTVALSFNPRL